MKYQQAASGGFSLKELMVTAAIFAVIVTASASNIGEWIDKSKIRANAEAVQNGIRFAQGGTIKHSRLVDFSLIGSPKTNSALTDDGATRIVHATNQTKPVETLDKATPTLSHAPFDFAQGGRGAQNKAGVS
jgi:prepilin-type N-terminal cleavage/methylation domain-containing protein